MRRIIRRREILADQVVYGEEPDAPGAIRALPLSRWLQGSTDDGARVPILAPADELDALAPHVWHLSLIVIDFPKVGEGRGFSQGRLLRQRHGFRGELRARGALKRDQLFLLARCGFDAFDLDPAEDLAAALAAFDTFKVAYQGGSEDVVQVQRRA